jgi:hypothetical protein
MVFPEESLGAQPSVVNEPSAVGKEPSADSKKSSPSGDGKPTLRLV